MKAVFYWSLPVVAVLGVSIWGLSSSSKLPVTGREVAIKGGRTDLSFLPNTLKHNRIAVEFNKVLDQSECASCSLPGFKIENSSLNLRLVDGRIAGFDGGKLSHKGSFTVTGGSKVFEGDRLTISPKAGDSEELSLIVDSKNGSMVAFDLCRPRRLQKKTAKELVLQDMDVLISKQLANEIGEPSMAGTTVGSVTLYAQSEPTDGGDVDVFDEAPAAGLDLALSAMSQLSVASNPTGKVGTYPNGRTGLTMSTTSCNVGTVNVPWSAPMQTNHPVIALNLYRLIDGHFMQVGWSWLKHGFLATNSNGCGSCQNPGTGALLGVNCSDTYGTGNNQDRTYLGGRDEYNPFAGVWTCQGSWFSNYQNDCIRRNPGSATIDAVDHRLDCLDSDLGNPGAHYYYEAFYLTGGGDINMYNNIGSREASIAWNGNSWNISTIDNMLQGPALNRWGDLRTFAEPRTEGDVIVAVKTTDLGNGNYHYEYAVYNHNLDRQVREFRVPLPFGATVSNIGFHDIDRDNTNGWVATQEDHALIWSSPEFGQNGANPLKYSSLFNFWFDANVQPAGTKTTLGLFKPGTLTSLIDATTGPLFLEAPLSYTIVNGLPRGGNLQSLADVDGNYLKVGPNIVGGRDGAGIECSTTVADGTSNTIMFGVRSNNSMTTPGGAKQSIELYNWNTTSYESVDVHPVGQADTSVMVTISSNAARFINGSTHEVKARILHRPALGSANSRWVVSLDQVGFHFQ